MIGDVAQSIRQIVQAGMAMPANSVRPEGQLSGAGTQVQHMATVKIIMAPDLGWPAVTYENVDGTKTSPLNENVDQLKEIVASVNFYRGGNADPAGQATYTTHAMDDASRVAQRLRMGATAALILSLGLTFVKASQPRDLSRTENSTWKSRGQVDLTFYVVNRESDQINSIGSGTVNLKVDAQSRTIEVP